MHFLALALCLAAPIPREARLPPEPTTGVYTILWSGQPYRATFNGNGEFSEFVPDSTQFWVGVWSWDSTSRTLAVRETHNGGDSWFEWSVVLDRDLCGRTDGGTRVSLRASR